MPPPPRGSGNPTTNEYQCDEYVGNKVVAGVAVRDIRPPINPQDPSAQLTRELFLVEGGASGNLEVRQWTLAIQARSVLLPNLIQGDPIPPRSSIIGQRVGHQLQARVQWSLGSTFDNEALLDIGDNFQWSVPAKRVRIKLIYPPASTQIVDADPKIFAFVPPAPDTQFLSEISGTLSSHRRVHQFSSISSHTLTETKDTTGDLIYFLPPLARAVRIYMAPGTVAPVPDWEWISSIDPGTPSVGALQFPTTTPLNAGADNIPGNAIALRSSRNDVASVVWTVRPT